jgi:hypothetical protein
MLTCRRSGTFSVSFTEVRENQKMTIQLDITIKRTGNIVEIVGTGCSVNFLPKNYSKTLNAIMEKLIETQPDLASDETELTYQKQSAEAQLTEIYKQYEKEQQKSDDKAQQQQEPSKSAADILVELAIKNTKLLFEDQYGTTFALVYIVDHNEIIRVESDKFKHYLSKLFYDNSANKVVNTDSLNNAIQVLQAKAEFEGPTIPLVLRVALHNEDNNTIVYYYDLTNDNWEVIKITAEDSGWSVEKESPLIFRRYNNQEAQVYPVRNYTQDIFDKFMNLINVKDEDNKLLLKCYIVSLFIPDIPKPILMLHGEQGSAKSTLQELIKMLVDPSVIRTLSFPRDINELIQKLSHNYISYFDNISKIKDWISDQLCRAVTGSGFSKRQLYTDDDDIIYNFRRCIGFNGINLEATKADLLDRGLIIALQRIPKEEIRSLKDIWDEFEQIKPELLGYIFDILVKVLDVKNKQQSGSDIINLKEYPRMADFAEAAEIISRCMGYSENKFLAAYYRNIGLQTQQVLEASPVAAAIMNFMRSRKDGDEWIGTATELLDELEQVAETLKIKTKNNRAWPSAPNSLSRRLNEVKTNLREIGIIIERPTDSVTNTRLVKIRKISPKSPVSLADEKQARFEVENPGDIAWDNNTLSPDIPPAADSQNHAQNENSGDSGDTGDIIHTSSRPSIYRLGRSDTWACKNCKLTGDRHFMKVHYCRGLK